jgi:uncharacterized protein (DUF58 family)
MPRLGWGTTWLLLAGAGALLGSGPLSPAVYALGGLWLGASLLTGTAAASLAVRQTVSDTHVAVGQAVRVRLAVRNRSRLPVPWLWLEVPLPVHLESSGHFRALATLRPRGECTAEFVLRPSRRGRYRIGTVRFRLSDWFGLCRAEGQVDLPLWITVYPRIQPLPPLQPRALVPEGPRRDRASPFREELAVGLRAYTPGDPQRWIAWKASARRGELQVREFPRVRERATTVVLDMDARAWAAAGSGARAALERALSVAASFFWAPPDGPQATGLFTHAASVRYVPEGMGEVREPARLVHLPPRRGTAHRRTILEVLSVLQPAEGPGLEQLLLRVGRLLSPGETVLALTAGHHEGAWAAAARLAARHHPVTILTCAPGAHVPCPGVQVLPVSPAGRVEWR